MIHIKLFLVSPLCGNLVSTNWFESLTQRETFSSFWLLKMICSIMFSKLQFHFWNFTSSFYIAEMLNVVFISPWICIYGSGQCCQPSLKCHEPTKKMKKHVSGGSSFSNKCLIHGFINVHLQMTGNVVSCILKDHEPKTNTWQSIEYIYVSGGLFFSNKTSMSHSWTHKCASTDDA